MIGLTLLIQFNYRLSNIVLGTFTSAVVGGVTTGVILMISQVSEDGNTDGNRCV